LRKGAVVGDLRKFGCKGKRIAVKRF